MSGTRKPPSATRRTAGAKNSPEETAADAGQVEAQAEAVVPGDVAAPTAGDPVENASADPADTGSTADEDGDADADASGDSSPNDDDEDAPDADRPAPCEECFPLGFPQDATSVGCEHGQWSL